MPKSIKAIDLVWKAQPAVACLKIIAEKQGDAELVEHFSEWLDQARELLKKKDWRKK